MKSVYSTEEISKIANELGFSNLLKFESYLAGDYNIFWRRPDGIEDNAQLVEKEKNFFTKKIIEIRQRLHIDKKIPRTTEEKIEQVIAISKQMNIDYLMSKFGDKIDEKIAERLVEYGYTHGNCSSIANALCEMFPECKLKIFHGGNYGHQCVEINGKYYDIRGCSTQEEMKEFVEDIGGTTIDKCSMSDFKLASFKIKLFDYAIKDYLQEHKFNSEFEQLDKKVAENMETEGMYRFDLEQIDEKIEIPIQTKQGDRLFIYRAKKQAENPRVNSISQQIRYYVINEKGCVIGRIPINVTQTSQIIMDYHLKEAVRGQGIGTIMLNEIVRQIFEEGDINGLAIRKARPTAEIEKTDINSIELEINDNPSSQRIAEKNGFTQSCQSWWILTKEDYLKTKEEKNQSQSTPIM